MLFLSDNSSVNKLYSPASFLKFKFVSKGIYFGSEAILRIRNILEQWQKMKEKYENNEITKEALEDWKVNYPDSLKKDYVPFEESNLKRFHNSMLVKVPPEIK